MERKTYKLPSKPTKEILTKEGIRKDKRNTTQFRNVFLRCGMTKSARGSAYVELNNTKVMCTVYGPFSVTNEFIEEGRIECEFQTTNFASKEKKEISKEYSTYMTEALESSVILEKFPKSVVKIFCLVLEDDGSSLSAAVVAGSLALANAGFELYSLVSACSIVEINEELLIDPTMEEELNATSHVVCCMMTSLNEISQLIEVGVMDSSKVIESLELCVDGCSKLHSKMEQALEMSN
jgi:exosome complex component MTR3